MVEKKVYYMVVSMADRLVLMREFSMEMKLVDKMAANWEDEKAGLKGDLKVVVMVAQLDDKRAEKRAS